MKNLFAATMFVIIALSSSAGIAGEQTIKLSVPGMSCASCPYIVKQAISSVDGIKTVEATMEDRSATVTFEDTLASVEVIQQATANVGYPATILPAKGS